ncbi:MAG: YncE family protein [Acidobacteriota bacterium]|nr:YncE family protein [Acidobacteriota bacterium]
MRSIWGFALSFIGACTGLMAQQLPGMPPVQNPSDIYAADHAGDISPVVRSYPALVYVPNSKSDSVSVIDQKTFKVIATFPSGGKEPQHVVPQYDMKRLWVINDLGDTATPIDPATGKRGKTIPVEDPYNMYYTPDGKYAIVVAERKQKLNFLDPETMKVLDSVPVECPGVDHMDFTAAGRYLIASCEFSGQVIKVDVETHKVVGYLKVFEKGMPQDVKTSPDGKVFYVADMVANGVHLIDPVTFKKIGFIPTGAGTHGLYVSRDSKVLYISNRGEGSITVLDLATRKILSKWVIPHGGSPDMGGVSADGKQLWLSGRYHSEVYVFDTSDGKLLARIKVGKGPHGLCVYPQPGRYSLGHTGVFR